jgi:hypothetical protein
MDVRRDRELAERDRLPGVGNLPLQQKHGTVRQVISKEDRLPALVLNRHAYDAP